MSEPFSGSKLDELMAVGTISVAVMTGCARTSTVLEWSKGTSTPNPEQAEKIAVAYDIFSRLMQRETPRSVRALFAVGLTQGDGPSATITSTSRIVAMIRDGEFDRARNEAGVIVSGGFG